MRNKRSGECCSRNSWGDFDEESFAGRRRILGDGPVQCCAGSRRERAGQSAGGMQGRDRSLQELCVSRRLSRHDFLERFYNYYRLEWGHDVAPADPKAPPSRRAEWPATPETIPPYPFTEWPYGGSTSLGVTRPSSVDSPLMSALGNTQRRKLDERQSHPGLWLAQRRREFQQPTRFVAAMRRRPMITTPTRCSSTRRSSISNVCPTPCRRIISTGVFDSRRSTVKTIATPQPSDSGAISF